MPWNLSPHGIHFDKNVDCGSQGEDVEHVNVVVFPSSEVQKLKREICCVEWEKSGGNEVLQEVNALLSVEPLSARERQWPQSAPLVDCPFKGKHVLNDRAGHLVVFEESVELKLQVTQKHQDRAGKVPHRGKRAQLEA